ncbi:MAG: diaminopimelate epimerase [Gammaproteobacteria bacterium]|uniref:Diaminopimelate epimerase n=1 Tax=Candidatus Thiopontia autotrophica TaxID=2841688 RepID=A0A8J6NW23_9GAMM|nr:diaminopimelate epimerase [Candidatus Thiopontia autotrophica]MBL6969319.1 diaminopimelate epimerase [Gammaproteobacteria bacterium]
MRLRFTKMHGLGNDFVVINAVSEPFEPTSEQVRFLADRNFGVGCDQLLLVEPAQSEGADFRYRIWNADGGEVEQCGNGARCFARFVRDQGLTNKDEIVVETASGIITLKLQDNGWVTVNMGPPILTPSDIPFVADEQADTYDIEVDGDVLKVGVLSMGNPHVVLAVDELEDATVNRLGPLLESHERFPQRVNVGFMRVVSPSEIHLRVYERGTGETMACGTGACAAVVTGIVQGKLSSEVKVGLRGGELSVRWMGGDAPVMMTGPAETVFEGVIEL